MKYIYTLFFVFLLLPKHVYSQHTKDEKVIVCANDLTDKEKEDGRICIKYPTEVEILNALNGGGLKLSNPKLVKGEINADYGYPDQVHGSGGSQVVIFKNGLESGYGMDTGVLFSTGNAISDIETKNTQGGKGLTFYKFTDFFDEYGRKDGYSDPDLIKIFENAVNDVVVFTFDVELALHTSALRVAFQFGSEEYPDFVGSIYNDAFGFFVSGDGIEGTKNMAIIPYTGDATSINTINGGKKGVYADTATFVSVNSPFYVNNGHSFVDDGSGEKLMVNTNDVDGLKNIFIEYNGLTKLLTYDLINLVPGGKYTFKIAIADATDTQYDSGVLVQKIQGTTGADVSITKEIDNETPNVGDVVEFTLKPYNYGPYSAHNVVVKDFWPSGYEYISSESSIENSSFNISTGEWRFPVLNPIHERPYLKIKAKVKSIGEYKNKVRIDSSDIDPDPTNNEDEVTPDVQKPAAIGLVKIGKVDDTVDGEYGNGVINYTFTITNEGDVPLKKINLEDFKIENQTSTIKPFIYVFEGDDNEDELLNVGEKWTTTATYHITDADTDAEKVENRATVYGKSPKDVKVSAHSKNEQGLDSSTITPVEGGGPLMTNPHIYHKVQ